MISNTNANNFHTVDITSSTNLNVQPHGGIDGTSVTTSFTQYTTCSKYYPVEATNGLEDTEAIENTYLFH